MSGAMLVSMLLLATVPAVLVALGAVVHLREERRRRLRREGQEPHPGGSG